MEFQPNFQAYKLRGNRDVWEGMVLTSQVEASDLMKKQAIREMGRARALPPLGWGDVSRHRTRGILSRMYQFEQEESPALHDIGRKGGYYSGLGRDIRRKRDYSLIRELYDEVNRLKDVIGDVPHDLMIYGIYSLYGMVCDPGRFLVGLKEGVYWKDVNIATRSDGSGPAILNLASHYVPMLKWIGKRELPTVPESLIHPEEFGKVRMPSSPSPVDHWLEDAYFHQQYLVPPEGAEVRFRRARDLNQMIMVKSGNNILARVITSYGDEQVIVNLEDASFIVPDRQFLPKDSQSPWAMMVAETYHDLVIAEEVSAKSHRRLREKPDKSEEEIEQWNLEDPQVIYIPRQMSKSGLDPRPKYDGPPRPVKPHLVTNHFRTANMTDRHRDEILDLEKEWGLSSGEIANHIPGGKTWVRPHFSPSGAEVIMRVGPIFIKRKILAETGVALKPSLPRRVEDFQQ